MADHLRLYCRCYDADALLVFVSHLSLHRYLDDAFEFPFFRFYPQDQRIRHVFNPYTASRI